MLPDFCAAVSASDSCKTKVIGFCDESESSGFAEGGEISQTAIGASAAWWPLGLRQKEVASSLGSADGFHIHGLWEEHGLVTSRIARSLRKPYLVSAHGMLEPWALKTRRLKKAIYASLVERRNITDADCLHALTVAEAEAYRRFGAKNPIAVIPNGVCVPTGVTPDDFLSAFPNLREKRLVLFLGRLHYKKGLDILVNAWKQADPDPDTHMVIAGPDFENTQSSIERQVGELNLERQVTFCGMLSGSMKWSALAACTIFVLPSHSEGLSVSILEAMGMNKPVIVTRQCNMPEVLIHEAGWVIEPDPDQLASALRDVFRLAGAEVDRIGRNGGALVAHRFNWPAIGTQMRSIYQWLLGGPKPTEVDLLFYEKR